MAWIIESVNGKPERVRRLPDIVGPIKPEFKPLPDMHQALLQESKRLNDEMRQCLMAAPI